MAHFCINSVNVMFLLLTIFSSLHYLSSSLEFQVGGTEGWVVPPANDTKVYNVWASENRFQVGDIIFFKYKKDSVMEVTEKEYNKCNSTRPKFFSNTGDSAFRLDHSGSFYFISGVSGHCEKGQKMIVKVISPEDSIPSDHKSSTVPGPGVSKQAIVLHLVYVYVASYLF
ncbi:early nodulin-like protein 1 [Mangifera indica]|uniref:early nodulin-like protein 1 n=1 Tax=Mangifera indica TaxID=29780 RepID=UPI001CFA2E0F|nr:early nodulin-like protein 1 [Mangifera indica]